MSLPPAPRHTLDLDAIRQDIVGLNQQVPLLDGTLRTYTFLDNAASTPPFQSVLDKVNQSMQWYSSVHRGSGMKSLVSTEAYEQARQIVADFLGADPQEDCVIFGKNTTEAINQLAYALPGSPEDVILVSALEHHSNDLPWRAQGRVVHIATHANGCLDLDDYRSKLAQYRGHIRFVAVSGASNVSGFLPPIYQMAEMAHQHGSLFMVDAAQLAPHRKIHMGKVGDPQRLDFVVISGHKMYAPFGTGALVGARSFFRQSPPTYRGGGTIDLVSLDEVIWSAPPERFEAGSPNIAGAIAMAASMKQLSRIGMDNLAAHETELTAYTLEQLNHIDGVTVYGSNDPACTSYRLGVIAFGIKDVHHSKVAAILSFEGAIGVRDGCFCAHPYVVHLLQVSEHEYTRFRGEVLEHDRSHLPGLVRASFGCYNNTAEVDHFIHMVKRIAKGQYSGDYVQEKSHGGFYPRQFDPASVKQYFSI